MNYEYICECRYVHPIIFCIFETLLSCCIQFLRLSDPTTLNFSSGAFEVYLNGELVFSRLQNGGRMPSGDDITSILASKSFFIDSK